MLLLLLRLLLLRDFVLEGSADIHEDLRQVHTCLAPGLPSRLFRRIGHLNGECGAVLRGKCCIPLVFALELATTALCGGGGGTKAAPHAV